jgi:membrane fusion protein (multidrug efflux system)
MARRIPRKAVLIPIAALVVAASALVVLDRRGIVPLPWLPGGEDAGSAAAGKKKKGEKEEVPVPVELARVEPRAISAYYRASSVVEADRQVRLVAKIGGRVSRVNVEEGDWVRRGEVLAELENEREKLQQRQAELKEADQRRETERRQALLAQSLVTEEEFAAAKSLHEQAVAERELSAIRVEETLVRAPFDGQVTERLIVPGQFLSPAEPVFTLVDFEPLRVRIHLPEAVGRRVSPGDHVQLDVEALEHPVPAVVERIAPVVEPGTSTMRLTLRVQGDAHDLRVGGFVKARIVTDTRTQALSVPKLALVEEGGLRSVFVAEADTVRKIEVSTGLWDDSHVEVLDGLEAGAWVVSLGQGGLRTGAHIEVLNATQIGWTPPPADSTQTAREEPKKEEKAKDGNVSVAASDAESTG